ncbi:RpiB/LacA/LacB family sugar-phosphate isomerase [bacterium D16-76]|nr:RpiB/LacA/LacB family sugar-phosphate isomerase [bacterium D16-76]
MKIAIGSDRRGLDYKTRLIQYMEKAGHEVVDVGTHEAVPCDYPIYAEKVGKLVAQGECIYGVVICGTGIGISIAANKVPGIRCGVAYSDDVARFMREHNDANIIAFGQSHMEYPDIERRLDIFLRTSFAEGYHVFRINQLTDIECGRELKSSPLLDQDWKATASGKERK